MHKNYVKLESLFFCFISFLLLASCSSNSVEYPPNKFSEEYSPLKSENLGNIHEIDSWNIGNTNISLIRYDVLTNKLVVASEQDKEIITLDPNSGKVETVVTLNIPTLRILGLDRRAEKLLGAIPYKGFIDQQTSIAYLQSIGIWDTSSGSLVECITGSCEGTTEKNPKSTDTGATMDPDGETVVTFGENAYQTLKLLGNESSSITLANSMDAYYWWHIGNIAIDSRTKRLAVVFQEGRIQLENNPLDKTWIPGRAIVLDEGNENQIVPIHAALFDGGGKWLAVVRGDQLSIWDIAGWKKSIIFQDNVGTVHGIQFDPASKLLLLGSTAQINVISLEEKKLVAIVQTPDITTFEISADNRLLFWADVNGIIHVWGIKT